MSRHLPRLIDHLEHVSWSGGAEFGEGGEPAKMKSRVLQARGSRRSDGGEDAATGINKKPEILRRISAPRAAPGRATFP